MTTLSCRKTRLFPDIFLTGITLVSVPRGGWSDALDKLAQKASSDAASIMLWSRADTLVMVD